VARLLAEPAAAALGQPVVIENRAGAGGNIGTRAVAQAAPDGHTLVLNAASPLVINQFLYQDMGFDPATAFAPVSRLTTGPLLVVTNPNLPFQNMGDLVAEAKHRPGALNYATAGNGTVPHLATELFMRAAGVRLTNVTYRQTPDATQSVMRGDTAVFFDSPASIRHVRAGTLRALAVTTPARFAPFPDIPTVAESGGPEISVEAWYGLLAPAGTPPAAIARLHAAFVAALQRPEVATRIAALGFAPVGDSPGDFGRFLAAEAPKWGDVIRAAEIRIQ
jgi:tripartite-type tricarboxylate transporter receptor subunit TctC